MRQCRSILRRIKGVPLEPVLPDGTWVESKKGKNLRLQMGKQEKRVRQNRDVPRQEVPDVPGWVIG